MNTDRSMRVDNRAQKASIVGSTNIKEIIGKPQQEINEEKKQQYDRMIMGDEPKTPNSPKSPQNMVSLQSSSSQNSSLETFRQTRLNRLHNNLPDS